MIKMAEKKEVSTRTRKEYGIFIYNDDTTPFEFVVVVIAKIFSKSVGEAVTIAATAQDNGKAVVVAPITKGVGEVLLDYCKAAIAEAKQNLKVTLEEI